MITKIEVYLRRQKKLFFTKWFVRTDISRYLVKKKKTEYKFIHKSDKNGRWKSYSFETEIDAQACNVSYQVSCFKIGVSPIILFSFNKIFFFGGGGYFFTKTDFGGCASTYLNPPIIIFSYPPFDVSSSLGSPAVAFWPGPGSGLPPVGIDGPFRPCSQAAAHTCAL